MYPRRYSTGLSYSFGPGPVSSAIRALIGINVAAFIVSTLVPSITVYLGLCPAAVLNQFRFWQPLTYMFLHGGLFHILFNMLALWMFGVELERLWGTRFFLRYYIVTGIGAAASTLAVSLLPFGFAERMYYSVTIGASGAVYALLLAYALYYPDRPILMYFLFPIPAKYFVLIIGGISFMSSTSDTSGGIAHTAHLGGLVFGYLYLKGGRGRPLGGFRDQYAKWKMNRLRRRFEVLTGGRKGDWGGRVH